MDAATLTNFQADVVGGKVVEGYASPAVAEVALAVGTQAPDGLFSPNVTAALKQWQQANGLQPNGAVDAQTWNALVKAGLMSPPPSSGWGKILLLAAIAVGGFWAWRRFGKGIKKMLGGGVSGPGAPLHGREERERDQRRAARRKWLDSYTPTKRREPRLGDAVTDSLIDKPAELAREGDCDNAVLTFTKVFSLAKTPREQAHLEKVRATVKGRCPRETQAWWKKARDESLEISKELTQLQKPGGTRRKGTSVDERDPDRGIARRAAGVFTQRGGSSLVSARREAKAARSPAHIIAQRIEEGAAHRADKEAGGRPITRPYYITRDPAGKLTKHTKYVETVQTPKGPRTKTRFKRTELPALPKRAETVEAPREHHEAVESEQIYRRHAEGPRGTGIRTYVPGEE